MSGFQLSFLKSRLPPVIARSEVGRLLGGIISAGTLANEDSAGTGPRGRFYIGRKACYPTDALLEWLEGRIKNGGTHD